MADPPCASVVDACASVVDACASVVDAAGRVAGLVLAGGAATRMGGVDKPLLAVGGISMLARVLATIGPQVSCIAISANGEPSRYAAFGHAVLPDGAFFGCGPLAGILAGLDWAAGKGLEALLTVPADTPFIPTELVAALTPAPAVAASGGRRHHLVALWPVAARRDLCAWLARPGPHGAAHFAETLHMRSVEFPDLPIDPFTNVNTPSDLARARAMALSEPAPPE
jgi:molybdopterin-guanine dinucleotide biosynthesis protein A